MGRAARSAVLLAGLGFTLLALLVVIGLWQTSQGSYERASPRYLPHPAGTQRGLDPARSRVTVDPLRITNDGQAALITVILRDKSGRPLAGEYVRLAPTASFLDSAAAWTDARGAAILRTFVPKAAQHQVASSGLVRLRVTDLSAGVTLPQEGRLAVYNRVAVLLQGLGTSLQCSTQTCLPGMFDPLVQDVLAPLGFRATGAAPTILVYSYQGGTMVGRTDASFWLPAPYDRCDTVRTVAQSVNALQAMLLAYRAQYPYSTFELIGHSLGGLLALQGIGYSWILEKLGPAAVDKVITIDSPVNGIDEFQARSWLADLFAGIWQLHSCRGQGFGLPLVAELAGLGARTPSRQRAWLQAARAAGVSVLTTTNRQDIPVPEAYSIIDDRLAAGAADRLVYAVPDGQTLGHSALLYPVQDDATPNPSWADFTARLRAYIQEPCLAFASASTACYYPSINLSAP